MRPSTSYRVLLTLLLPVSGGRMFVRLSTLVYSWVLSLTFQLKPTSRYRIELTASKLMVGDWMVEAGQAPFAQTTKFLFCEVPPAYQRSVRLKPQTSFWYCWVSSNFQVSTLP